MPAFPTPNQLADSKAPIHATYAMAFTAHTKVSLVDDSE